MLLIKFIQNGMGFQNMIVSLIDVVIGGKQNLVKVGLAVDGAHDVEATYITWSGSPPFENLF